MSIGTFTIMGRYYTGDIEGKFWFGVQSSDDASFFGGNENGPNHINYYFDKSDLSDIQKGLRECKKQLGNYKKKIDNFFDKNGSYNDKKLAETMEIKVEKVENLLKWYARLELGNKILNCVKEQDQCSFEAEL